MFQIVRDDTAFLNTKTGHVYNCTLAQRSCAYLYTFLYIQTLMYMPSACLLTKTVYGFKKSHTGAKGVKV